MVGLGDTEKEFTGRDVNRGRAEGGLRLGLG